MKALQISTMASAIILIRIIAIARMGEIRIWVTGDAGLYAAGEFVRKQWGIVSLPLAVLQPAENGAKRGKDPFGQQIVARGAELHF